MWSCVSATRTLRILEKLITDPFFIDSCGSLAVARTVLTGDLSVQSDITCTSAVEPLTLPFQKFH